MFSTLATDGPSESNSGPEVFSRRLNPRSTAFGDTVTGVYAPFNAMLWCPLGTGHGHKSLFRISASTRRCPGKRQQWRCSMSIARLAQLPPANLPGRRMAFARRSRNSASLIRARSATVHRHPTRKAKVQAQRSRKAFVGSVLARTIVDPAEATSRGGAPTAEKQRLSQRRRTGVRQEMARKHVLPS
jgi:hypothetical protein